MVQGAKEDLNTCPVEWLLLLRGFCRGCERPMISKRKWTTELDRWYVRCGSSDLCTGCYVRNKRTGDPTPRPPAPRRRTPATPLTPEALRALRVRHGACPECGWTADASDTHVSRGCASLTAKGKGGRS